MVTNTPLENTPLEIRWVLDLFGLAQGLEVSWAVFIWRCRIQISSNMSDTRIHISMQPLARIPFFSFSKSFRQAFIHSIEWLQEIEELVVHLSKQKSSWDTESGPNTMTNRNSIPHRSLLLPWQRSLPPCIVETISMQFGHKFTLRPHQWASTNPLVDHCSFVGS